MPGQVFEAQIEAHQIFAQPVGAASMRRQIEHFGLADIVDEVLPYGCIMAGDWEANAPWRKKKERREAEARRQ